MKYSITRNGKELYSGQPDVCEQMDEIMNLHNIIFGLFGFPFECPISAGQTCTDHTKKYDISQYKTILPLTVGVLNARYDVTHDTV